MSETMSLPAPTAERQSLLAGDGRRILIDIWRPEQPIAFIHLLHGLGEHPARYERFAAYCNQRKIAVAAHNHRGHGENCTPDELGHIADKDGWSKLISDTALAHEAVVQRIPGVPRVLLGHSMGSYIAQSFLIRGDAQVSALILSGSALNSSLQLSAGHWLAAIECLRGGGKNRSKLLNAMGFGSFNKPFAPNRTAFDWLSRDQEEVDKYLADPLCGADSSSRLWFDLTGGLLSVRCARALRKIPADLPILITGGGDDPVGGEKQLTRLAQKYQKTGHANATLKIYPQARHEMFNETNRDEFSHDLTQWLSKTLITQSG